MKTKLTFYPWEPHVPSDAPWRKHPCHSQKIIFGTNEKTGKRFRISCDEGIAPLILKLNKNGVRTIFSCQGGIPSANDIAVANVVSDSKKADVRRLGTYVMFRPCSPKYLAYAVQIIQDYWKNKYLSVSIDCYGRVLVSAYDTKDELQKHGVANQPGKLGN